MLDRCDVDLGQGMFTIRRTKFGKTRLRERPGDPVFTTVPGRALSRDAVERLVAKIRDPGGRRVSVCRRSWKRIGRTGGHNLMLRCGQRRRSAS